MWHLCLKEGKTERPSLPPNPQAAPPQQPTKVMDRCARDLLRGAKSLPKGRWPGGKGDRPKGGVTRGEEGRGTKGQQQRHSRRNNT